MPMAEKKPGIKRVKDGIILSYPENFDIKSILECGQVFRYKNTGGGYAVWSKDKYALVAQTPSQAEIVTADPGYFYDYFDLGRDYGEIATKLTAFGGIVAEAAEYGKGIRLLNQDFAETAISFVLSANNNIKRIQGIIERLAENLGDKTPYGHAFPSVEKMVAAPENFYREIGCGYRAPFVKKTAEALSVLDPRGLAGMGTQQAKKRLMELPGVGGKVADCILLFALKKTGAFPVDTWIQKVYDGHFSDGTPKTREQISRYFSGLFGGLAGYVQQYLFYFARESIAKDGKLS